MACCVLERALLLDCQCLGFGWTAVWPIRDRERRPDICLPSSGSESVANFSPLSQLIWRRGCITHTHTTQGRAFGRDSLAQLLVPLARRLCQDSVIRTMKQASAELGARCLAHTYDNRNELIKTNSPLPGIGRHPNLKVRPLVIPRSSAHSLPLLVRSIV